MARRGIPGPLTIRQHGMPGQPKLPRPLTWCASTKLPHHCGGNGNSCFEKALGPEPRQRQSRPPCNRSKESISLDLKSGDGQAVLQCLPERADVVIENFRPGVMDRLGFSTVTCMNAMPGW